MTEFEPVRVAVLGAGRPNVATQNHLPAIAESELLELVGVGDVLEGVEEYAREYGVRAYREYGEMLEDAEVEVVQVATPDWCHAEQVVQGLEAGKHVQVQKPLCANLEEIGVMREAWERSECHLGVVLNTRRLYRSRFLKGLLEEGRIGELVHIDQVHVGRRFPLRDFESRYYTTQAGSVWLHNGMHVLDTAAMYVGAAPVGVQGVSNRNPEGEAELLGAAENFVRAMVEFENGVTGNFEHNTMMTAGELPSFGFVRFVGTEGEIYSGRGVEGVAVRRKGEEEQVLDPGGPEPAADVQKSFRMAFEEFARMVRDGEEREPSFDLSCRVMEILFRALEGEEVVG